MVARAVIAGALLAVGAIPTPAAALELHSGERVVLPRGEVVSGDLYVSGGTVEVAATVRGDVLAAGGTVIIDGDVQGSVMAVGGTVRVGGKVGHAVRLAGGDVLLSAQVATDALVFAGSFDHVDGSRVGGDLLLNAGDAQLGGVIAGNVQSQNEKVVLTGVVQGNWQAQANDIRVTDSARVDGKLAYRAAKAELAGGAKLGSVERLAGGERGIFAGPWWVVWGQLLAFAMALATGVVLLLLLPRAAYASGQKLVARPAASLGWGALALIVGPVVVLLLFLSVIGVPLALLGVAAYLMGLYLGQLVLGMALGDWLLARRAAVPQGIGWRIGALALGLAVVYLVGAVPILGWVLVLLGVASGIGAILLAIRGGRGRARNVATTAPLRPEPPRAQPPAGPPSQA